MKQIRVPYNGKVYSVSFKTEMIDLSMTSLGFLNVHSVFIDDEELQKVTGKHFTILHNATQTIQPCLESSANIEEMNAKKTIAQQVMNDKSA